MLFHSRQPDDELVLTNKNDVLPPVVATQCYGIILDDKLSWKPHISNE